MLKYILLAGALVVAAGIYAFYRPLGILNLLVPRGGYKATTDVAYGPGARQMLDIYVPEGLTKPAPVILFVYGGRWQSGRRQDYRFAGQAFASKGYVAVVVDTRIYPESLFPDFVDDTASALVWAHKNIANYNGDPNALFTAGHSSGAFSAIMVATNPSFIESAGGKPGWLRGAIGLAGPYDFLPFEDADIVDIFSAADDKLTQPITFVTGPRPPMFLGTGTADDIVQPKNARNLAAALQKFKSPVTVREYEGIGHIGILLSLAKPFRGKTSALEDIGAFIDKTLNAPAK